MLRKAYFRKSKEWCACLPACGPVAAPPAAARTWRSACLLLQQAEPFPLDAPAQPLHSSSLHMPVRLPPPCQTASPPPAAAARRHPDKRPEEEKGEATAQFQRISAAYQKLTAGEESEEEGDWGDEVDLDDDVSAAWGARFSWALVVGPRESACWALPASAAAGGEDGAWLGRAGALARLALVGPTCPAVP